ncbi:MFS transporter [Brachyspira pulli]|uniref:MFS transporter n=1 Tax=Brachyspira pulli TaxID=310721 RepID=UPI0030057BD5
MNTNMKVGLGEKIGYGIGDLACNLIFSTATSYLMYYYTDIAKITATSVATLFLVASN